MISARFLLSLILVLAFASTSFAGETWSSFAPVRSIASVESRDQENDLVSEIDRQADVVFTGFLASSGSRVPLSTLKKAQRAAVYRLKQMHVLTDILKSSGPAPATAMLATEILTNFVLAPIATAVGRPALAGIIVAGPWGLVTGFSVFAYQIAKQRLTVARSLGIWTLGPLDKLRKLVVGYDLKYRVSSVVYQSMMSDIGEVEFEVLRKGWAFDEAKMPGVLISELETIVSKSVDGPAYLQAIQFDKFDSTFYSALLLRFINENDDLTGNLLDLVRARIPEMTASNDALSIRRHLLGVGDVKLQLTREIQNSQKATANLKKRVKDGEMTSQEAKALKAHSKDDVNRLHALRGELMRHEYAVLLEAQAMAVNGVSPESVLVSSARSEDLLKIALEAHVRPPKNAVIEAARTSTRLSTSEQVRAVVRAVSARPLVCQDLFY
jgi:hypothetical protein